MGELLPVVGALLLRTESMIFESLDKQYLPPPVLASGFSWTDEELGATGRAVISK